MRWYIDKRVDDGIIRHLADSEGWKEFDLQHPDFALKPHNVRLGLVADGFNPFGNMNNNYNMWPVILIPYNIPPWLVMNEPYFMLSLLIPGPHQSGNEIDGDQEMRLIGTNGFMFPINQEHETIG